MPGKFRFSIDRGGTFTDIYAEVPNERGFEVEKLLSVDPQNYDDAPREGIRRIMERVLKKKIPTTKDIDTSKIEWIRMGTTVATNALLERKGEPTVLVTTKGFKDLLAIGNQSRPHIFDLKAKKPSILYQKVIEVEERVRLVPTEEALQHPEKYIQGISGEWIEVLQKINTEKLESDLKKTLSEGISSAAVVLIHSYTFTQHEIEVGKIAKKVGFKHVSLSSEVMPMIRGVPRGLTTCVDAYLTPIIRQYIDNFCAGFKDNLKGVNVTFMQSDGGLTPADKFSGCRAIMSGPAGGVVGFSATAYDKEKKIAVIGFDMGGTSTDVSRFGGKYEHVYSTEIAGAMIQAPQLDIRTVAAGGGSRLFFKNGLFVVGPESSGAHPGPVCYRKGGPLSVTDANLFLGRIIPDFFPKIFGKEKNLPLDYEATKKAFEELTEEINEFLSKTNGKRMTPDEVAYGFIRVANETMCRPIRAITVAKGYDTRDHILACFGGAGAQHACAIAKSLGIRQIFIHRFAGLLSAYGLGLADVVHEEQEPCAKKYIPENYNFFEERLNELFKKAIDALKASGFDEEHIETIRYLNMRFDGTDYAIMTNLEKDSKDYADEFLKRYQRQYGFLIKGRDIVVDDIRIRAIGKSPTIKTHKLKKSDEKPEPVTFRDVYFEGGRVKTPIYMMDSLNAGAKLPGPCIIIQGTSTIVVIPEAEAEITEEGNVCITLNHDSKRKPKITTELDTIQLSIFAHRFMSIAEQMGNTLQRTSISTNIKERLDFSCALFGPNGGLVANAPHLPVHLGSMSEAVTWQLKNCPDWKEGEVLVTNHPSAGGSHLPDITVITPVYKDGKPVFFVASRGHHADIGGISPGSMPPFSRYLSEEGAAIKSFKLVKDGEFQLEGISELLKDSRALSDNIADLKAQVSANQKGIALVQDLINEYTLEVVQAYMKHVQDNAELAVKNMLSRIAEIRGTTLEAEDYMDDGSKIKLKISIDLKEQRATLDFTGTSPMILGNLNAPRAVTVSAVLYCLRCLVKENIPLNEGCLKPINIIIPKGSILDPIGDAGVVGGNVLTSQRVTDVILKAFHACAASQGCMNNFTFGNESLGYYETIAGGSGAGPNWHGQSGVHTHMTNTRITDVEIMEKRYPVLIRQFSIRENSGGRGKFRGGDGVIREIEFLKPLDVGILSERRVFAPYGMEGGEDGKKGENYLIKKGGMVFNLGGKNAFKVEPGDVVKICSPGGGGWGKPDIEEISEEKKE